MVKRAQGASLNTEGYSSCTCTAVYDHGSESLLVVGSHSADHGQHGCGILWYPMVWPGGEVELTNLTGVLT